MAAATSRQFTHHLTHHLFLSYAWDDPNLAIIRQHALPRLKAAGYRVFIDVDHVRPSNQQSMYPVISEGLHMSAVYVCFVSKAFVASRNCVAEVDLAFNWKKPMLVVCTDDDLIRPGEWPPAALGFHLSGKVYIPITAVANADVGVGKLIEEVAKIDFTRVAAQHALRPPRLLRGVDVSFDSAISTLETPDTSVTLPGTCFGHAVTVKLFGADVAQSDRDFEHNVLERLQGVRGVCKLMGSLFDDSNNLKGLVFEDCPGGTLEALLDDSKRGAADFKWADALVLVVRCARILEFVNTKRSILHLDFKSSNVAFDSNRNPKLINFGCAFDTSRKGHRVNAAALTRGWACPDVEASAAVRPNADVFSLGVLLLQALTGLAAVDNCPQVAFDESISGDSTFVMPPPCVTPQRRPGGAPKDFERLSGGLHQRRCRPQARDSEGVAALSDCGSG